ncbi:MAG: molybdenum cofactor guanylyltransferase [Proteobacteria bacterium]|nr:molybdenum cofactor guanylyltransferase [Pseudomonadota bacterium]
MPERDDRLVAGALSRPHDDGAVLGVIFAGGASRRYGRDKALARLDGIPLLQRVVDRFAPQVSALVISGDPRPEISVPAIPDSLQGAGPLAALYSVLRQAAQHDWPMVATVSCDTPFIPVDIVARLGAALKTHDCAVASRGGVRHPTCTLWAMRACPGIEAAFEAGVRSLHGAVSRLDAVEVDFSAIDHGPGGDPFYNINSPEEMATAQAWAMERHWTG